METSYTKALDEFNEWFTNNIPEFDTQQIYKATETVNLLMKTRWAKRSRYRSKPNENPHKVYDGLKSVLETLNYLFVYVIQVPSVYHDKIIKLMREVNKGDDIEIEYRLKIKKIKEIVNS